MLTLNTTRAIDNDDDGNGNNVNNDRSNERKGVVRSEPEIGSSPVASRGWKHRPIPAMAARLNLLRHLFVGDEVIPIGASLSRESTGCPESRYS